MSVRSIRTPEARFSCQSCGRCCTMWSVTVDADKVAKLRERDWSHVHAGDPFERNRGPGDAFRVKMIDGRCFFLDEQKLCTIHKELDYDAKPEGCKAFPLHFVEVGGASHGRLSFYCPSVSKGEGKRLRDQQRWLKATRKAAGDVTREAKLTLDDEHELTPRDAEQILTRVTQWMRQEDQTVADRVAAGAGLMLRLCERADEAGTAAKARHAISAVIKEAGRDGAYADFVARGRADGFASRAGPLFSLFLGADAKPGKLGRMGHFFGVRGFNLGLSKLRSQVMNAKASRKAIAAVRFDPPTTHDALLTRYFRHKLEARRPLVGDASLVGGYNVLVAAYGVINLLTRLSAAAAGRGEADEHDVAAAVQAADLLVVEHTTLRHGPMFGQLVDTILAPPGLCASVLARLEKL
jgi:Fe-S-cluster containining protein